MEFRIDRRAVLATGAALALSHMLSCRAQETRPLRFARCLRQRHPRRHDPHVSKDVEPTSRSSRSTVARCSSRHRARRASARQPGDVTSPAGHQQTVRRVGADLGLHLPRRQPRAVVLRQRRRAQMKSRPRTSSRSKFLVRLFSAPAGRSQPKKKSYTGRPGGVSCGCPRRCVALLGRSLGANPTPMASQRLHRRNGAIDGQTNPLAQRPEHEVHG